MDRTRPFVRRRLLAVCTATALALPGLAALAPAARAADVDLARNGGFESGLGGWSCTAGTTVGSPVHSGTSALQATPAGSDNAQCSQTVTVQPNAQYTLGGQVRGSYVYLGASGTGTTDVSTWTQSATDWQQLTTTFRTGPHHQGHDLHARLVRHGRLLRRRHLAGRTGRGRRPAARRAVRTEDRRRHLLQRRPVLVGGHGRRELCRLPGRREGPDGRRHIGHRDRPGARHGIRLPGGGRQRRGGVREVGDGDRDDRRGIGGSVGLPAHALVGYLHASFANGSGYTRLADVPDSWDVIDLAFGEPTSVTSGDIRFTRCPVTECSGVESDADFKAAVKAKQAAGKKVLISIGGQNGQVQLTTTAARDAFVSSVSKIIDTYGLDGLDIDFEGHSLSLNANDTDFRNRRPR